MRLPALAVRAAGAALRSYVRHFPVWRGKRFLVRAFGRLTRGSRVELPGVTRFGARINCRIRDFIESRIYLFGVWEPNLTAFLRSRLSKGDVFLDIGANVGYFSLLAADLVGSAGTVVAVEASPSTFARLETNVAANGAANIRLMNVAAANVSGTARIYKGPETNAGIGSILPTSGLPFEAEVPSVPFHDLLSDVEVARCRVVKIDVEGAEGPILENLLRNVERFPERTDFVVEISPNELGGVFGSFAGLLRAFERSGYTAYVLENDYDYCTYRSAAAVVPPALLREPTDRRQDLVFSRAGD